jgi:hypothetical protein
LVDLGLEVQQKLVLRQGRAQVGLQRRAAVTTACISGSKKAQGVAPGLFGLVHGQVGLLEQLAHAGTRCRSKGAMPMLGVLRYW